MKRLDGNLYPWFRVKLKKASLLLSVKYKEIYKDLRHLVFDILLHVP